MQRLIAAPMNGIERGIREGGIKAGREREEIISVMLIPRRRKERRAGGLAGYVPTLPRWRTP